MELIIVMTILAMLSMSVVPVFSGSFADLQTNHSIRDLAALVKYAQERAVTDGVEFRLNLEPDENSYWLERFLEMEDEEKVFELVEVQQQKKIKLPDRLILKTPRAKRERSGAYYISFYPSGACDNARINITNLDGKMFYIDTNGGIGRLKVGK